MEWWQTVIGVVAGLLVLWGALIASFAWISRGQAQKLTMIDALRLGPDVIRLTYRLASDRSLSWRVRAWLFALLVYLLSPIDLVPDFIPVIGYLDDALIVAVVLRFATRHAGSQALERHWPGTPEGLRALRAVTGLAAPRTSGTP